MAEKHLDKEFLEHLIKALVAHPEDVKITRNVDEMGVLLSLKIHSEDMGQVIGRQGSTARAIRSLLRIVGLRNNARVNLKIEEPEGSTRPPRASSSSSASASSSESSSESADEELKL